MVAGVLAKNPGALDSPESFKRALNDAYELSADVAKGAVSAAAEVDFRNAFRQESLRHSPLLRPTAEHLASLRPVGAAG